MQMQRALTSRVTRGIAPGTPSIRRPLLATRPLLSKAPLHIPYSVAGAVEGSAPAGTAGPAVVEGAIVDGFPIAPEQLLNLAKAAFATNTGVDDDSVLADDFRSARVWHCLLQLQVVDRLTAGRCHTPYKLHTATHTHSSIILLLRGAHAAVSCPAHSAASCLHPFFYYSPSAWGLGHISPVLLPPGPSSHPPLKIPLPTALQV